MIERFDRGLVTALDAEDVSPDAATDGSQDLDADAEAGKLQGRKSDTDKGSPVPSDTKYGALIRSSVSSAEFLHSSGTDVYSSANFTGARTFRSAAASVGSITAFNREVRVGATTPKVVGYFNGGIGAYDAELYRVGYTGSVVEVAAPNPTYAGSLQAGITYHWAVSTEYDDYEESSLSNSAANFTLIVGAPTGVGSATLLVYRPSSRSSRITRYHLYRGESIGTNTSARPQSQYRWVRAIEESDAGWSNQGSYDQLVLIDKGDIGETYELRTGMSDVLTSNFVNYKIAVQHDSELVVAQCTKTELDDAMSMIFKSKSNRPDMFNWIEDYLKMPTVPVALASFNGRVFAFDQGTMYRVNTDGMYIEDAMTGVGLMSPQGVLVTEFGMFIAARDHAYVHTGQGLQALSEPIANKWRAWTAAGVQPIVAFHTITGSVLFINPATGGTYVYNIQKKRWDYWTLGAAIGGAFPGLSGELFVSY